MTLEPSPIHPLAVQVISSSAVGVSVELQLRGMTAADFETDSELLDGFRSGAHGGRTFSGQYGDLGAAFAAILLDREARGEGLVVVV